MFESVIEPFTRLPQEMPWWRCCRCSSSSTVGGVHGLAQKRMLPLIAFAAFTYGIRYIMSRLIEKLVSAVSFAVSTGGVAGQRVVAGADRDAAHDEVRAVGRVEQQLHRLVAIGLRSAS